MRIAIVGTGAVGGYFGALLARAGHDVRFLARGPTLAALRARGLRVTGSRGDLHLPRVAADDDPRALGPVDYALFCVKLYGTEAAGRLLPPLIGDGGCVVSLQNGVDSADRLNPVVGASRVLPGAAFVSALAVEPGVIRTVSDMSRIVFGEQDGSLSARGLALRDAGRAAGFGAELVPDIRLALWTKFVQLATNAALTALVRKPAGVIYRDPDLLALAEDGVAEAVAVGRAEGVALAPDLVARAIDQMKAFPPAMYASQYHDLAAGRPLELEGLSGLIMRLGRRHGIATPVHRAAYCALKPYAAGATAA